nr:MAG TPA: hypothetical protein [Caudoviricetes sp.]
MFKNLFKKKDQKEINAMINPSKVEGLHVDATLDGGNTKINVLLNEDMTNEDYVAITSNTLMYIALDVITRYNLNPEAYVELLKKDVLNALANSQRVVKEDESNA